MVEIKDSKARGIRRLLPVVAVMAVILAACGGAAVGATGKPAPKERSPEFAGPSQGDDRGHIHACVNVTDGGVRIVGPSERCLDAEFALHWGIRGRRGPSGPAGVPGPPGLQGPPELAVTDGSPAPLEVEGPRGPRGPKGVHGPRGPRGPRGAQGLAGPQGPQGVAGSIEDFHAHNVCIDPSTGALSLLGHGDKASCDEDEVPLTMLFENHDE